MTDSIGGSEVAAQQAYLSAVRKCEALKEEYDTLHKRYADLMSSHSATVSQLEVTQEELTCLRKRYDEVVHELKTAIRERNGLQQQCTAAIRQWDNALRERNEAKEQLSKVQQQRDEAMKEITQAMAFRIKATKDLTRLTEERNATYKEYNLVMSERDTVHKEIERLQEEISIAQQKLKASESQRKATFEEVESLRREVAAVLQDRDHALKECNDLREKYGDYVTGREDGSCQEWSLAKVEGHQRQWSDKSMDMGMRKEQNLSHFGSWELPNKHSKSQCQRMDDLDQANREIESLRRQSDRNQAELTEAHQEAEVCKRRRDWAFSERDKIVLERESIRTLCDKLRRERDRAVSDLAEALRDSDDIKRQRNEASKECKELREKMESQMEKESRMKQLNSVGNNYSRDSAIDADLQEYDVETLDVTLREFDSLNPAFEISSGKGDPVYEGSLFVSNIRKGSVADGRLKVSDFIMKINSVDVTNMDKKTLLELIQVSSSTLNMVVKRRRLIPWRSINTVNLQLNGSRPPGINIESGIYVSHLLQGSPAALEGTIAVGDRLVSINGKSLDSLSIAHELLEMCGSSLALTFLKYASQSTNSPPSSCSSGNNLIEKVDQDKAANAHLGNSNSSSMKESPVKDNHKKLISSGVQTDEVCLYSPIKNIPYNVISPPSIRSKLSSSSSSQEKQVVHSPSSQPTLLDRAYHKIFGERRSSKERKGHISSSSHHHPDDYDPIAELDSVIDHYSRTMTKPPKNSKKKQLAEPNSGTWPKYRGAQIQFAEVGTVASLQPHNRKERKSLASFSKHASSYDKKQVQVDRGDPHNNCGNGEQCSLLPPRTRERIPMFVSSHPHSTPSKERSAIPGAQVLSSQSSGVRGSSSGSSSYTSPECGSPQKVSYHSSDQLTSVPRIHYSDTTSPDSCLDYSVVSAHRDKDVLEYYKNRNRQRPKSAHYVLSDSECLSSLESSLSSRYCKPIGSPSFDQMSYEPQNDRIMITRNSDISYQTAVTTASLSPVNYLRSNLPFYPISGSQRVMHSHMHHPHPPNNVCGSHSRGMAVPLPSAVRYSSPPSLSIFTSRSGDSLLSGSTVESMSADTRSYNSRLGSNGRHSMKDSGRYSFTPSPSPCPSQYSYSGPSPTHSIDLAHFHPIAAASQTPKRLVPAHAHVHQAFRVDEHYSTSPSYDGIATLPKRTQRIRIPSNPSVASKSSGGKVSTSSIEKAPISISERNSPLPAFTIEWLNSDDNHPIATDYRGKKPDPGDMRNIYIEKSSEPLGIKISCGKAGGGIFVSSVTETSLAAQVGLQIGDQLLEVCGINMRSATYQLAANVLRQCGDNITMLVQYNPESFGQSKLEYHDTLLETSNSSEGEEDEDDDEDEEEEEEEDDSPLQTPAASPKLSSHGTPVRLEQIQVSNEDISSSATSTLTKQKVTNCKEKMKSHKNSSNNTADPRLVILKKATSNLGISLLGGNAVGIFIHSLQDDSPAAGPNGLRPGDQILEYNGIDLRQATAEEAAYELAKPTDKITVLAQFNVEKYTEIQDQPGDSFYIKTLFDRSSIDGSLPFRKDDVIYVDNTMFNGVPGLWRSWLVDQEGQKVKCGYIPSKYKMEEELLMKRSLGDLEGDGSRRGSTSARRSFFRRKKHQRNNSRDSKELASFSDVSINSCSDSGILGEEMLPPTYMKVERLDCKYLLMRPVILVGPLMEVVVDKLEQDFPHIFQRCIPEVMRGSQQMMERGLQEFKFVDYRRRGSHFECTTVASVKEICNRNCHGLLDVCLSSAERLNRCQIFPIIIFLKFRSTKQIREVKDSRYLTEKLTTKAAKEMYEHALKIESEYKPIINAVIPGSNLTYMCTQVKMCVEEEQNKTLWVASKSVLS